MEMNDNYEVHSWINCIDAFEDTTGFKPCRCCGLVPKKWEFDNGRSTACGCWNSAYNHFSIRAESIMSIFKRTNSMKDYHTDDLRNNWNHWCDTGEILFSKDGRW